MNQDTGHYILIVDDDPYVLESASNLLRQSGHTVIACQNAADAVRKVLDEDVRVVLTDIKMPGTSGIDLLEKVRDVKPKIPVILMTGYAELNLAIEAIKKGAYDFVKKPYTPEYLMHTVEKACRYTELLQFEEQYKQRLEDTVRHQTQEIFSLSREVIQRLTSVAEFRDVETGAHISRIGLYGLKLAEALNMPAYFINAISYASSLHDIGKIGIADSILLKPGAFSPDEFEIMKGHTTIGHQMLTGSSNHIITMAASIALNHHEKWDGTGYPRGLKGADIPIEGRIIIICDQYDALMSRRPYKPALSHDEVFAILTKGDGRTEPGHFDPHVLGAFKDLASTFQQIYSEHQD